MHNNTNYHGWNKALTFGVGSIQLSFRTIVFTQYMQRCFQSKCYCISAEGLHFSACHSIGNYPWNTMVMFKMGDSVPSARYSSVCNVLRLWNISLIPTYSVYRFYDTESDSMINYTLGTILLLHYYTFLSCVYFITCYLCAIHLYTILS